MKVRNGFVSNSSSTSFIIQINDNTPICCDKCGQYNPGSIFYIINKNATGRDSLPQKISSMKDIGSEIIIDTIEEGRYEYLKNLIEEENLYFLTLDNHGDLWDILDDRRVKVIFSPEE